jgi:hypothetical protein
MKTFHTVARFQSTTIEWRNLCREGSSPKKLQRGWLIAVRLFMAVQPHGAGVIPFACGRSAQFRSPSSGWTLQGGGQASCVGTIGTARPLRKNQ